MSCKTARAYGIGDSIRGQDSSYVLCEMSEWTFL